ncbi:hypothetical protein [Kroppenstedtia eburnea]|uniref:Uncharacterized protein n=1 Tax=Kroppenstedtia eburnea TaxID=714067 RepID=A0A1N7PGX2_9BACL|nr:hypothetical protein [Kroppenstedtia eburnea]QKI83287.1 hypothetical protein GXN75_15545 [Kroppenstedtia eburnea]SIT09842.1 hypothetical protein SAMN05421790_11290 [Kroppenstedtia eburnea]
MKRWVGYWLMFCFGLPIIVATGYVLLHQRLLDTPDYYPYWLAESYFYPALPAIALLTWKVHWGKRNPFAYFMFTLSLITGVLYLGTGDIRENLGNPVQEQIHPLGVVDREVVTREGRFEVPYFPLDRSRLLKEIQSGGTVDVTRVEGKGLILSFSDGIYRSYSLLDRVLDLALRVLSVAIFVVFFYVVMTVWWRDLEVTDGQIRVFHWRRVKTIPLSQVIQLQLDSWGEEIQVETEEVIHTFPYDSKTAGDLAAAAKEAGLTPIRNGRRWLRTTQFREIRMEESRLVMDDGEEVRVPYDCVAALLWDPVIQITMLDETDFVITDERYTDRAWFDELSHKVKEAWIRDGQSYTVDVDPRNQRVALTLDEWME